MGGKNTTTGKNQNSEPGNIEPKLPKCKQIIPMLNIGLAHKLKVNLNLHRIGNTLKVKRTVKSQLKSPEKVTPIAAPNNLCIKLIFFILLGIFTVIITSLWNEINEDPFDFTNASLELQKSIYGQNDAINQLIDHYRVNVETFNVVVLVGGTGVGKSYTGKIITKHFPHKYNIFEYNPPLKNNYEAMYHSLSAMHCNLVIFEHLKMNHLTDLVSFVKLLYSKKQQRCTMVVAIINPEIIDKNLKKTANLDESLDKINEAFLSVNIPIKTIRFAPLTSDVIDICIKNEAKAHDIRLTDEQLQEIRKHLVLANSGCKGAHAKVQLYAIT